MSGFIEGESRSQATLFPERIDDYIADENAVSISVAIPSSLLSESQ
jgi:hypothetical protein